MQTHQQGKVRVGKLRTTFFSIIVVLIMLLGAAIAVVTTVPAKADTGGYPYASIACVWSPYATTGTGNWCKKVNTSGQIISDYDWGTIHDDNSSKSEQSPYGYDYRNCTDYVAWEVASLGVLPAHYTGLGNAKDWPVYAPSKGLTVNTTPAIGAAAVKTTGTFGHVAFISAYDSSTGVITVQEYNSKGDGNYGTRSGTLSSLGFSKVVHFEKYETGGQLNGTAAVSATDVWAVGDRINNLIGGAQTLIEHWNGSSWKVVSSPNPDSQPGSQNALYGVAAVSANDVWAVGSYDGDNQTLIEHWNGSSWKVIPSPNSGSYCSYNSCNTLSSIAAVSATDIWAVGSYFFNGSIGGIQHTLIEHWNGSSWKVVPSPSIGSSCTYSGCSTLSGVAVVSTNDVWAVGSYGDSNGFARSLTEHWNGSSWKIVSSPNPSPQRALSSVAVVSATNVWAAGSYYDGSIGGMHTLIEYWNGSSWKIVPSPNQGPQGLLLSSIVAVSTTDVWAVGYYAGNTLIEHWNGSSWNVVPSPNSSSSCSYSGCNTLSSVATVSTTDVWAVGSYYDSNSDAHPLIEHWNGSAWNMVPTP